MQNNGQNDWQQSYTPGASPPPDSLDFVRRNIVTSIILTFVTCGIYMIFWWYHQLKCLYWLTDQPSNAGMDVILTFITCGIYGIYIAYKMGKMEAQVFHKYGMPPKDDSILYLVLRLFGFDIVNRALIQSNFNTLADFYENTRGGR